MPSRLTRQVFRRLLAGQPIVYRGCLRQRPYSNLTRDTGQFKPVTSFNVHAMMRFEQRRTFLNFNFFQRNERAEKEADMDPGLEKMMELAKRERMRARMPPLEEVSHALNVFFRAKSKKRSGPITDNQARLVVQSLQYVLAESARLQSHEAQRPMSATEEQPESVPGVGPPGLPSLPTLQYAVNAMRNLPDKLDASHTQLAKLLYDRASTFEGQLVIKRSLSRRYVKTLAMTGDSFEARRHIEQFEGDPRNSTKIVGTSSPTNSDLVEVPAVEDDIDNVDTSMIGVDHKHVPLETIFAWIEILGGFAREGNEAEVQRTLSAIRERGIDLRIRWIPLVMIKFCISRNDLPQVRRWWENYRQTLLQLPPSSSRATETADTLTSILTWCLERGEVEFGQEIVKDIMTPNPPKAIWDAVFVWAAGTGKGVDEINRMIGVMEKSNEAISDKSKWRLADIRTINALVEFAVKRKDPYMAERFIMLGKSRDIQPDAWTYVLQMQYRLSINDVDGALVAYKSLQSSENSSNEDLPTVNKLIVALCKKQNYDFDTIMNVAADLSDRRVTFEAETVSALSLLHLNRDEHKDVLDLLNTHAYHYSTAGRNLIRDAILANSLDPKTSIARAWNGYLIIYDLFDETPRQQRTELMETFIARERSDMGVRIFQQMRAHSRADTMPTLDTYTAAFLALAKLRDLDALDIIHNQLKLDYNVLPTTYVRNTLMLAYTACGDPESGLRFWSAIVASKEGPSYNSIHIALRACEKSAFGDLKAREVWSLLRRRGVELDHALWCSFLAALVGNGNVDQSFDAIEAAEEKGELVVDPFLLGCLCDAAPWYREKQAMIEDWATEKYPEVWRRLQEEVGFEVLEVSGKRYKVDRRVSP